MTKLFAAAAMALTLGVGALAMTTPANAAPTYGFSIGDGQTNPFGAVDGR